MKIVAEGLETPEEINKVLELGVDLLQGFYIAKPQPVPEDISPVALKNDFRILHIILLFFHIITVQQTTLVKI